MKQTCRICKHELEELAGFEKLARVTSDCRPHPAGGNLGICLACATVQKPETPFYVDELGSIYSDYDIYYQGGGKEQLIFDQSTGQSVPRSTRVVELLHKKTDLPEKGRLLDIGCGGGHFLKSFATRMPHWEIFGYERDREAMARACSLVPEATIMHGNLSRIKGLFDIVSINHTFEHVPAPAMLLKDIRDRLAPSGLLLINVPDFEDNPFDLIIADHCTHFTRASLTRLLAGQGFSCLGDMTGISKELLAVARKCAPSGKTRIPDIAGAVKNVEASLTWLGSMAEKAARTTYVPPQTPTGQFAPNPEAKVTQAKKFSAARWSRQVKCPKAGSSSCPSRRRRPRPSGTGWQGCP